MDELASLLREQDGVVARRQLLEAELTPARVARLVRRHDLVPLHPGVYVEHNGPPAWAQRAWGAVLYCGPGAALCGSSALRAHMGVDHRGEDEGVIHVAVDRDRHVSGAPGLRVHRYANLVERVRWNGAPPRVRYDETVLDLAVAARDDLSAVAVLADAVGSRRTTAPRLVQRLAARTRVPRRAWLEGVLDDVAAGTCSVLEHGFQTRVVRPHGLPAGDLQAPRRTAGGLALRDVEHPAHDLAIELDGCLFHTQVKDRAQDLDRDLEAAASARLRTVRLGYAQVFSTGCRTARLLGTVLQAGGWQGQVHPCPECGGSDEPG